MSRKRSGAERRRARKMHLECASQCRGKLIGTPTATRILNGLHKTPTESMVQPSNLQVKVSNDETETLWIPYEDGIVRPIQLSAGHTRHTMSHKGLVADAQGATSNKAAGAKRGQSVRSRRVERHRRNYERDDGQGNRTAPDSQAAGTKVHDYVRTPMDRGALKPDVIYI